MFPRSEHGANFVQRVSALVRQDLYARSVTVATIDTLAPPWYSKMCNLSVAFRYFTSRCASAGRRRHLVHCGSICNAGSESRYQTVDVCMVNSSV